MARIQISTDTDLPPEALLGAITDFTSRRVKLWPNIDPRFYEVHELGSDWADVTEGSSQDRQAKGLKGRLLGAMMSIMGARAYRQGLDATLAILREEWAASDVPAA